MLKDNVIDEVKATTAKGYRSLVTTLTKKMAEDLTEYMHEQGIRVRYMHSDVDTLRRVELLRDIGLLRRSLAADSLADPREVVQVVQQRRERRREVVRVVAERLAEVIGEGVMRTRQCEVEQRQVLDRGRGAPHPFRDGVALARLGDWAAVRGRSSDATKADRHQSRSSGKTAQQRRLRTSADHG